MTATRMRHVLVTGGAGLIGSHLCDALLARGSRVTCVDDFRSGSRRNLAAAIATGRLELVEQNVVDLVAAADDIDAIFNLACPASPPFYQRDPVGTLETCVLGAMRVFAAANRLGVRVVHTSTSEVYGDPLEHPQSEGYWGNVNPVGARACYDEGKRCVEALAASHARQHGLDVRVARIFNTYGPRMRSDDGRVVSNFVVDALAGRPLTVYGDGSQTRSFCYVEDTVAGLIALADAPRAGFEPINLGNPEEVSIGELARRVVELTGSRSPIIHRPLPEDDPHRRRPDVGRAAQRLGWKPTTPLDVGLSRTIRWLAEQRSAGD
ncbi:MAG: UDP-glucuronic acid decarboxylase family protein [Burkholderiales bacterium]